MEATQEQLMRSASAHFNRAAVQIANGTRLLNMAGNDKAIPALKQFIGEMVILTMETSEVAETLKNNESPEDQPDDQ